MYRLRWLTPTVPRVLESRIDWEGYFAVVDHDRIRMRSLATALIKKEAE
jgi:hypothetical protein